MIVDIVRRTNTDIFTVAADLPADRVANLINAFILDIRHNLNRVQDFFIGLNIILIQFDRRRSRKRFKAGLLRRVILIRNDGEIGSCGFLGCLRLLLCIGPCSWLQIPMDL